MSQIAVEHTSIEVAGSGECVPTRVIFRKAQLLPTLEDNVPQMALVFNSARRVLKMDGFPALLKENCEIIECGRLADFAVIDFVRACEKYGAIQ